jgi:hypothetical protein
MYSEILYKDENRRDKALPCLYGTKLLTVF